MLVNDIITELQGIKGIKPENIAPNDEVIISGDNIYQADGTDNLISFMKNHGFKRISNDLCSYSSVFSYKGNKNLVVKIFDTSIDKGYMLFLKFCRANPFNPCLPVFKGKSIKISDTVRMIRIERLFELEIEEWISIQAMVQYIEKGGTPEISELTPNHLLYTTLLELRECSERCSFDIHSGNFMKRSDGQIVVIDPYAHG